MVQQSNHVLRVRIVETLELFYLVIHLDLQSGSRCIVLFVQRVDQQREERFLIDAVFREIRADAVDLVPVIGILICYEGGLDLLGLSYDAAILRNDTADDLRFPAKQSASLEGLDDLVAQCAAGRDDSSLSG